MNRRKKTRKRLMSMDWTPGGMLLSSTARRIRMNASRKKPWKTSCTSRADLLAFLDFIHKDLEIARYVMRANHTANVISGHWNTLSYHKPGPTSSHADDEVETCRCKLWLVAGYGHIVPRTTLGRFTCVVYALLGVPLMMACLSAVGEKLCQVSKRWRDCRIEGFSTAATQRRIHVFLQCEYDATSCEEAGEVLEGPDFETDVFIRFLRSINMMWTLIGLAYISMGINTIMQLYLEGTKRTEQISDRSIRIFKRLRWAWGRSPAVSTSGLQLSRKKRRNAPPQKKDVAITDLTTIYQVTTRQRW
ncbi:hypothetical protein C0Q70_13333 [Pomacea canaliculata]|uniref:Potassium channel domain-containing protein n=1 Tax=Pomacea canaliculata TaxID=400727 RepID=A0A2T7NWX9_POMCA|nr:hypothetical protein C0Q70_13333 [Pomacea canaliculata]